MVCGSIIKYLTNENQGDIRYSIYGKHSCLSITINEWKLIIIKLLLTSKG